MSKTIITGLLWFSAIGCGLIGGLYFAFSAVIMTSLSRIDQGAGIVAMNAINEDIVRSSFMPIFLGTTLALSTSSACLWSRCSSTCRSTTHLPPLIPRAWTVD
jgi:uncharacterized membrane protein